MIQQKSHPRWLSLAITMAVLGALWLPAQTCHAETRREYVNRYVLLIDWISRAESWVTGHFEDAGLARMAHSIAERHVELTQRITPPAEFLAIHPHLLLVLENAERMFGTAASGNRVSFRRYRHHVHEEMRIISEILQAEGHFMPVINP